VMAEISRVLRPSHRSGAAVKARRCARYVARGAGLLAA
jgi:hypothetical protein